MDGDDAEDFFRKFSEDLNVDLAALYENWDRHFHPEAAGPSAGCFIAMGIGAVAGILVHEVAHWIPTWLSMFGLAALFCWAYDRLFGEREDEKVPISVQDLLDSAKAGRWVKGYDEIAKLSRS